MYIPLTFSAIPLDEAHERKNALRAGQLTILLVGGEATEL